MKTGGAKEEERKRVDRETRGVNESVALAEYASGIIYRRTGGMSRHGTNRKVTPTQNPSFIVAT